LIEATNRIRINRSHISTPEQLFSSPLRYMGGGWWLILGHLLAILRTSTVYSALRPSPNPLATKLRLCLVLAHMMPTKTSVGPNEVVRLEVLRLKPPLLLARRASLFLSHRGAPFPIRAGVPPGEASASHPVYVLPFAFCRVAVQPRLQEVHSTWLTDWRGRGEGEGPSHRFPPKSRQKASPECPPPSWDQPRPQRSPGGG
jgi:hypothetical protein